MSWLQFQHQLKFWLKIFQPYEAGIEQGSTDTIQKLYDLGF